MCDKELKPFYSFSSSHSFTYSSRDLIFIDCLEFSSTALGHRGRWLEECYNFCTQHHLVYCGRHI